MKFTPTAIDGVLIVDLDKIEDDRGFFARIFCANELDQQALTNSVVQANLSFSTSKGTVRGLHYQVTPALETKLVRCINGSIADIIVDIRPDSPTYLEHFEIELSSSNRKALFVPPMIAHGFQTLEHDTEVMYMVSGFYTPDCERGLRADDPALGITWPIPISNQSAKDEKWPLMSENENNRL